MNKKYRFSIFIVGLKFIAIIFSANLLFQGCVTSDASYKAKARQYAENNDFDSSVEYYNKACRENPDDLELNLLLKKAKQKASLMHMEKAGELISKRFFKQAITELNMSIAFYPGNHRAVELIGKTKKMKESLYFTEKGKQLIKTGAFKNAKRAFFKAVDLNPDNNEAKEAIESFRKKEEYLPIYNLDLRSTALISLKFKKTPVINVFEILSKLAGINFIFDKDVRETKVTLFMTDVKFDRFLDVLLKTNSLKAKMINRKTMLIYPDTPAKAKEYDELFVKTFYLSHIKAKQAVSILAKILKCRKIISNEKINAVTIRGEKKSVEMAGKIIEANDRTPAEVVLSIEIIEVSRKKEKELGLSVSETITFGVSETSSGIDYNSDFGFTGMASLDDISSITSKELYLSLPTATLKLLKKDGDTKILAKPQIRVSSSEKASILIGERIPLRSNRKIQTDGSTTYDYQYQDVGVKLKTEPVINMHNQITLKLELEISALGTNVGTVNDPQYSIKTRSTNTVLTIYDGDTVIIGGLINDEDRSTLQKVPLLGEIPAIGKLFSSNSSETINTDILMTITPVIIRAQDVPENDSNGFWSGKEQNISLKEPFESKNDAETMFMDYPDEDYIMAVSDNEFLPGDTYFSIQVNSFRDVKDAMVRAMELEKMGYKTWTEKADIPGKGIYHRVFVGQYHGYSSADEALSEMIKKPEFTDDIHIVDRAYVYGN
ncbi:MAG: SPOR domain-containing protein [Thermodesulfobacteriota bacterium]|nr:SPOR domain-containing protein [Thermodesulfobacteriota bacterium]